jgi:hypothetical protein
LLAVSCSPVLRGWPSGPARHCSPRAAPDRAGKRRSGWLPGLQPVLLLAGDGDLAGAPVGAVSAAV